MIFLLPQKSILSKFSVSENIPPFFSTELPEIPHQPNTQQLKGLLFKHFPLTRLGWFFFLLCFGNALLRSHCHPQCPHFLSLVLNKWNAFSFSSHSNPFFSLAFAVILLSLFSVNKTHQENLWILSENSINLQMSAGKKHGFLLRK